MAGYECAAIEMPIISPDDHQPAMKGYVQTGQTACYDTEGHEIACEGSGQDGESRRGVPWPEPRFELQGETVLDRLTGLIWTRNAGCAEFPVTWREALDLAAGMNRQGSFGFNDWRLPNRRELRSLMSLQARKPALPDDHPFLTVFSGWYWTSTSAAVNTAYAWYVHLEGARMFYGAKEQYFLVWPVRGNGTGVLPATGQQHCYDDRGSLISCEGSGQDGESRTGRQWPEPRFEAAGNEVLDRLTGLHWLLNADLPGVPVAWTDALAAIKALNRKMGTGAWRLPNINELESLIDCSRHTPALPERHPFFNVREGYWSSTTSFFEPDWAWALYMEKGAVGVGQKRGAYFSVWPVHD
jgi:hypothetical protein